MGWFLLWRAKSWRIDRYGWRALSAVCTHPAYRGKAYDPSLIAKLARDHSRDGLLSWLHAGAANHHAIALYLRLGFKAVRMVTLHQISRKAEFPTAQD